MSRTKTKKRSNLGKYLDDRGSTQVWLFGKLRTQLPDINTMTVSRWCTGESEPSYTQYSAIAQILGAEMDEIK